MEFRLKRFEKVLEVTRIANIHYFEFTSRYHTRHDRHAFRELIYADNSRILVESEHYTGPLERNQLIIHEESESHALRCPDDNAPNVIIIGFECHSPVLDRFSHQPTLLTAEQQRLLTEIVRDGRTVFLPPYDQPNLKDMKKRDRYPFGADQGIQLKLELLLISMVQQSEAVAADNPLMAADVKGRDVVEYLNQHYREPINLDELCFLFSTNKTTLCGQFRKTCGTTIIDYVNWLKIRDAKVMLREGRYNITQIAQLLGFSSVHYFSRLFKQYTHASPSAYIRSIRSKLEM